jgi:polyisoprenoid-binding protein YceI
MGENKMLKKRLNLLAVLALLFGIGAALWTSAAGANHPALPARKAATAQALPAPGTYKIDPAHSFAFFSAWHHIVGRVRGRFDKVTGTITASQDLAACIVDVTIDVSTISTQVSERDEDLRGPAYFDVKNFPTMTYHGRGIRLDAAGLWVMDGSLTIHGVSKVVPLTFTFNGVFPDTKPGKPARVAFHGTAAAKRAEFGIGARDNANELGPSPAAPDVEIEIDVEADAIIPTP